MLDAETGELVERRLEHESGEGGVAQPSAGTTTQWVPHPSRAFREGWVAVCSHNRIFAPRGVETKFVPALTQSHRPRFAEKIAAITAPAPILAPGWIHHKHL